MQTDEIFNKLLTKCEEYYNSEEISPDDNEEIDAIYVVDDEEVEDE